MYKWDYAIRKSVLIRTFVKLIKGLVKARAIIARMLIATNTNVANNLLPTCIRPYPHNPLLHFRSTNIKLLLFL